MELKDLFREYMEFPNYDGIYLSDVNQKGNFGDRPIHLAASRGNLGELRALLENKAQVNATGEHGFTALHLAVLRGHYKAVKVLIEAGADLFAQNDDGQTPLALAKICRDIDKIEERSKIILLLVSLTDR